MTDSELLKEFGFKEEIAEIEDGEFGETGFPASEKRYRIIVEDFGMSLEERYFWFLDYVREEHSFYKVDKLMDTFSASENSAFFGASQQRLGLQQDKVSSYMATIGKMVKELFQLVRELRILDERLGYYTDSFDINSPSKESAEITLKGIWVDLVEQGAKNPASVYGMARELGFATLPDLFFSTHPNTAKDVDMVVDQQRGEFNRKVKEVLKRKLRTFMEWKQHTHLELINKRKFTLKFLRQHFDVIKLYMNWVKPYLRNVRRLQLNEGHMDSGDMISAFENSMIEIEILMRKPRGKYTTADGRTIKSWACIHAHFQYRTMPAMSFNQEYNRGPLHVGRVDLTIRAYGWDDSDVAKYKRMKIKEDFKLFSLVDSTLRDAMEALGDELMAYLKEAGEDFSDDEDMWNSVKANKKPNVKKAASAASGNPIIYVADSFMDIFKLGRKAKQAMEKDDAINGAKAEAAKKLWNTYKDYKKAFRHLAW